MKRDYLFLTWNCPDCALLKERMKEDSIFEDDFLGKNGQHLVVINTYNNVAAISMLDYFKFPKGTNVPALYSHKEEFIVSLEDIKNYLQNEGFFND